MFWSFQFTPMHLLSLSLLSLFKHIDSLYQAYDNGLRISDHSACQTNIIAENVYCNLYKQKLLQQIYIFTHFNIKTDYSFTVYIVYYWLTFVFKFMQRKNYTGGLFHWIFGGMLDVPMIASTAGNVGSINNVFSSWWCFFKSS